ncbi:hypothetical protein EDB19DRAFT_1828614 [Suillus lakei]|nr:hypothetical protein EDB19DRAFT_1828614 [Suillus lakei]
MVWAHSNNSQNDLKLAHGVQGIGANAAPPVQNPSPTLAGVRDPCVTVIQGCCGVVSDESQENSGSNLGICRGMGNPCGSWVGVLKGMGMGSGPTTHGPLTVPIVHHPLGVTVRTEEEEEAAYQDAETIILDSNADSQAVESSKEDPSESLDAKLTQLMKDWSSPIYTFFELMLAIEYHDK